MASRNKPKDVSAWLGGNRGTVQSGSGTTNPKPTPVKSSVRPWGPFGFVQDIISPWLSPQPGQNKSVTQAQGLARAAAETLDQTVAGGLVKAGTQGNKALAKQAAINAGAAATGAVVAKVAGKVASNVVQSGVPARVVNKVTGQTVIIHGTDVRGLKAAGQQLMPSVPPARPDVGKVLFGVRASPMYDKENLARVAQHYAAERSFTKTSNKTFSGSAYVAKVPTKSLTGEGVTFVRSSAPGKIVSEIPVSGTTTNPTADFVERLDKAYKRAGGTYPKPPKAPKVKISKKSGPVRS